MEGDAMEEGEGMEGEAQDIAPPSAKIPRIKKFSSGSAIGFS